MSGHLPIQSMVPLVSSRAQENCHELEKRVNILGKLIRDIIYYPLYWFRDKGAKNNGNKNSKKLAHEEAYYKRFWTGQEPQDLNLEYADIIRERYVIYDQPVIILAKNGKKITTVCRVIETKECPKEGVFNALLLPGSLSTLDNNLFIFYDFLVAHASQENSSPGRFFIFGHYEMTIEAESKSSTVYKPSSFEACGKALKRTLETLQEHFGKFNLIFAQSAGCFTLAALLKCSGPELLPTMLHFDRGPSSIYEASRHYWFGKLLYVIAKLSGLTFYVDREITSFFNRCAVADYLNLQKSTCIITGVEEDSVYPGPAGLVSSSCLDGFQKKLKFTKWVFNPPAQINHPRAHHNWRLMCFNKSYLTYTNGNIEMLSKENLAQAILRLAQITD
ncbi:MAG: hypothetical protein WC222_03225 [Parachlamydiales bacterium]|jgi:hypothetical protein